MNTQTQEIPQNNPENMTQEERNIYQEKVKAHLDKINAQIDELKAKAAQAEADTKIKYNEVIEDLSQKRDTLQVKFDLLKKSSADAWQELQKGFEQAWQELSKSFENATKKFQ